MLPESKGEAKRRRLYESLLYFYAKYERPPSLQEFREIVGMRSYDTFSRHLSAMQKEGTIKLDAGFVVLTEEFHLDQVRDA